MATPSEHDVAAFSAADQAQLHSVGISLEEASRQRVLLASPPPFLRLDRPCVVGDGIRRLGVDEAARYEARGTELAARLSVAKFVPASGAATRMFRDLRTALTSTDDFPPSEADQALLFAERFAFFEAWCRSLGVSGAKAFSMGLAQGRWRETLKALLDQPGLGYAALPKAFIPFHRQFGRVRTALEEHGREAAALGLKQLHCTLSLEHDAGFQALLGEWKSLPDGGGLAGMEVSRSFQRASTDTLAGDGAGGLFRDQDGRLVLRPGGHGALLRNLEALAQTADVALLRNIDNIAHSRLWTSQLRYRRVLLGLLDEVTQAGDAGIPARVVGVVPVSGEPGGGPFWVKGLAGPQIVESAQVEAKDPGQKAVFNASTHFNPVDMACRLTDAQGRPFALERFADPSAVFLASKSFQGRPLTALERPGLWNGAMAHWKTLFVELPLETFNPVKTVLDLLKPAHQEAG